MEVWWISPALVGIGIVFSVFLGARRDAKHSGIVDANLEAHAVQLARHTLQFDEVNAHLSEHGERITAVESRCDVQHDRWEGPGRRG
jgi:hypothetical protein